MNKKDSLYHLLLPYWKLLLLILLLTLLSNAAVLWIPKIVAESIDAYIGGSFNLDITVAKFGLVTTFILIFSYGQSFVQTYTSELVASNLRKRLSDKISNENYSFIEQVGAGKLLTNFAADVDAIKRFTGQAIAAIISSLFTSIAASVLLLTINWKLALCVITLIPAISIAFFIVQFKVRQLYTHSRSIIDWLNKVIEESILGAVFIRVVNGQHIESIKFLVANKKSLGFGYSILDPYTKLIPMIPFTGNIATLIILVLGGRFVIFGEMSLGDLTAFNSYISMVLFPILMICGMSNEIAEVSTSFERISDILHLPDTTKNEVIIYDFQHQLELLSVSMSYGQSVVLKDVSFTIDAGSKILIVGPVAAGKTQLLYLLSGLTKPFSGSILFDGHDITNFNRELFPNQIGFVFQDSIVFNMSIRENIAFSNTVSDNSLEKAIETAELKEFISALPDKLNTIVSERGTSLSGGQKQRVMLARALASNPKILLLDDFIARVDNNTGKKIMENLQRNYPALTLISVTQKIANVNLYDKIIALMQGEIIGIGKHDDLMLTNIDYIQLFNSQQSTSNYEL